MAVDGTYRVVGEAMGRRAEGTLELKTNGANLEGTVRIGSHQVTLQDGKAKGNTFTAKVQADTPMGNMKAKVSGAVEGDRISGTIKALMVSAKFEGSRI